MVMPRFAYALLLVLFAVTSVGAQSPTLAGAWPHANKPIQDDAQDLPLVDLKNKNLRCARSPSWGQMR